MKPPKKVSLISDYNKYLSKEHNYRIFPFFIFFFLVLVYFLSSDLENDPRVKKINTIYITGFAFMSMAIYYFWNFLNWVIFRRKSKSKTDDE